jgi:predicted transposase/invertase (TIGR01784 family)
VTGVQTCALPIFQKGRQEGLQEGLQRGKLEVAQQLLELGMSVSQVAQVTGLSEQELQQSLLS